MLWKKVTKRQVEYVAESVWQLRSSDIVSDSIDQQQWHDQLTALDRQLSTWVRQKSDVFSLNIHEMLVVFHSQMEVNRFMKDSTMTLKKGGHLMTPIEPHGEAIRVRVQVNKGGVKTRMDVDLRALAFLVLYRGNQLVENYATHKIVSLCGSIQCLSHLHLCTIAEADERKLCQKATDECDHQPPCLRGVKAAPSDSKPVVQPNQKRKSSQPAPVSGPQMKKTVRHHLRAVDTAVSQFIDQQEPSTSAVVLAADSNPIEESEFIDYEALCSDDEDGSTSEHDTNDE